MHSTSSVWLVPFVLLVVSIVAVPVRMLEDEGLPRYKALKNELVEVNRTNERMRKELQSLQREVEALKNDPSAIEHIARDELGMVREDELIFQF